MSLSEALIPADVGSSTAADPADRPLGPGLALVRLDAVLGRALSRNAAPENASGWPGWRPPGEWTAVDVEPIEPDWETICATHPGWAWLRDTAALDDVELDTVLLALAPELGSSYPRIFALLQGEPISSRPTVDLALDLLTTNPRQRFLARSYFGTGAPLLRRRILAVSAPPDAVPVPLPARTLVLDEQIVDVLIGQGDLDRRLTAFAQLLPARPGRWSDVPLPAADARALLRRAAAAGGRPVCINLHGPTGAGQDGAARDLAGELGLMTLQVDVARLRATTPLEEQPDVLHRVFREAYLHGALLHLDLLHLDHGDRPGGDQPAGTPAGLMSELVWQLGSGFGSEPRLGSNSDPEHGPAVIVLTSTAAWSPPCGSGLGVVEVSLARPDADVRRRIWQRLLQERRLRIGPDVLDTLADRFRLHQGQIADAVTDAQANAQASAQANDQANHQTDAPTGPTPAELLASARRQSAQTLIAFARRIEPEYGWDDLVLALTPAAQLRELCQRVVLRDQVFHGWGFARKQIRSRGITALFQGPPGTGKTMAAEVVAGELGLDLFTIDLSAVVSKYIGETEKNLERIFTAAADADAVLFFDEADALFGKRTQVRDAHDRYANIETSYLLQRMEQHDGLAVLATNLAQNLDDAFLRRLQFVVEFPLPDDEHRARMWQLAFPDAAPLEPGLDLVELAREVRLAGGHIRNMALRAAFLAAEQGQAIGWVHLAQAVRAEYRKLGKVAPATFDESAGAPPGRRPPELET